MRFNANWGMLADAHMRRENFMADPYFYLLRIGAAFWIKQKIPVAGGYAHLWQAPKNGWNTWQNENRIFQQWSVSGREGKTGFMQRIRTEQRWKEEIIDDQKTGAMTFSFRLRSLSSFEFCFSNTVRVPRLVLSDEILVQFGQSVSMNPFDQNRFFVGLKFNLNADLSCDIGYMNTIQQRSSIYEFDKSDVFRLFFYYTPDFRMKQPDRLIQIYENTE